MKYQRLALVASAFLLTPSLHGAAVTYISEAAFLAAVGPLNVTPAVESFETSFNFAPSQTFPGFTATEVGTGLARLFRSTAPGAASDGVAALATNLESGNSVVFQFDAPIHAFAFDLQNNLGATLTYQTSAGGSGTVPAGTPAFFGIIDSAQSFSQISVTHTGSGGPFLAFDQVRFGAVPEPSVCALIALGALPCALRSRRRKR
jgi:hypothetical protein